MTAVFMFDNDGTLVDNDMMLPGTSKYLESLEIVAEMCNTPTCALDIRVFDSFFADFVSRTTGQSTEEASVIMAEMLKQQYGVTVDVEEFTSYRIGKRMETYRQRTLFIGDNAIWIANLPENIKSTAWIVTITKKDVLRHLNENPNLRIEGKTLEEFFGGRMVTGSDVRERKPSPECYNLAMELASTTKNDYGFSGIAVEDSAEGVMAAKAADCGGGSLFVVGVRTTLSDRLLRSAGADYTSKALHTVNLGKVLALAGYI